jgi:hypothetical protein
MGLVQDKIKPGQSFSIQMVSQESGHPPIVTPVQVRSGQRPNQLTFHLFFFCSLTFAP